MFIIIKLIHIYHVSETLYYLLLLNCLWIKQLLNKTQNFISSIKYQKLLHFLLILIKYYKIILIFNYLLQFE